LDPSLARAHAGLSFTHWLKAYLLAPAEASETAARAYQAAARAIAADPLDPSAQTALGRALWISGAVEDAAEPLTASVKLSPNFAFGHYAMGFIGCVSGDPKKGIEAIDTARRLSPLDPFLCAMHASRAIALLRLGRVEEAAGWGVRAALQPNAHAHVKRIGAICLAAVGKVELAREQARAIDREFPESSGELYYRSLRLAPDADRLMRSLGRVIGWT
ncbi:tetratricopeptide repeat protein, partial [Nostoc sp. NIES-2111]